MSLRVGLGPLVPVRHRGGVRVRASDGAGAAVDVLTDAEGWARFTLDDTRRWDLTAAEPGYAIVSLTGVRPPVETEVLLLATDAPRPGELSDRTVVVSIRGRSRPGSRVSLDGANNSLATRDDDLTLSAATWPGMPLVSIVAREFDASEQVVNGAVSEPFDLRAAPPRVVVSFPAPAVRPLVQELRIDLPTIGRVTAARFGAVLAQAVARSESTAAGVAVRLVGESQLRRPTDPSAARWSIEAFEGALAPEFFTASVLFEGAPPVVGSVTTRPSFRGVVPAFGAVFDLAASRAAGGVTLVADSGAWDRAAFTVSTPGGAVVWEGYAFDATPWTGRPLPSLPAGLTLDAFAAPQPLAVRACVLRDLPLAPRPWTSAAPGLVLRNLVTVCEQEGASLR